MMDQPLQTFSNVTALSHTSLHHSFILFKNHSIRIPCKSPYSNTHGAPPQWQTSDSRILSIKA